MFHLNLTNHNLKRKCEIVHSIFDSISNQASAIVVPKKGSKRFFDYKRIIAANDSQQDIWDTVGGCSNVFCYDFDNFPLDTQQMIYNLDGNVYIWAKPAYVRDSHNISTKDYLYKIYLQKETDITINKGVQLHNLKRR